MSIILQWMAPIFGIRGYDPPQHIVLEGWGEMLSNRKYERYFSHSHRSGMQLA